MDPNQNQDSNQPGQEPPKPTESVAQPSVVPQPFNPSVPTAPTEPEPSFGSSVPPITQPVAQALSPQQPFNQMPDQTPFPSQMGASGSGGNQKTKLILVGAGALVVLLGLIGGFAFLGGDEDTQNSQDSSANDDTSEEELDEEIDDTEETVNEEDEPKDSPSTGNPVTVNKGFTVSAAENSLVYDIKVLDYELGVVGVSDAGYEQKPFDDANQYVMVKISVKNRGTSERNIFTSSFVMVDEAGKEYGQSFSFYSSNEKDWGDRTYYDTGENIKVNGTQTGYIMYEVPKDVKNLTYRYYWEVDVIGGDDVSEVKEVKLF